MNRKMASQQSFLLFPTNSISFKGLSYWGQLIPIRLLPRSTVSNSLLNEMRENNPEYTDQNKFNLFKTTRCG
jgi:hypothetical protein